MKKLSVDSGFITQFTYTEAGKSEDMKKKRNWIRQITISAAAIMLAAAMGGNAHAATITFDGLPAGVFTSFTEGAFTVTALPGNPGDYPTIVNVGGADQNVVADGNIFDSFGTAFVITETDGGLFSLNSIGVADLQNDRTVQRWHCGSGSRIELTDGQGDCAGYVPLSSTFTTVSPSSGFSNISSLEVKMLSFDQLNDYSVDNINLTPSSAPEPSTMILVLGGFVGLGLLGPRREGSAGAV